jgi:hypothetical protein
MRFPFLSVDPWVAMSCNAADLATGGEVCKDGTWQCSSGVIFASCGLCVEYTGGPTHCCGIGGQELAALPTCAPDAGWSCASGTYSTTPCQLPDGGSTD